MAKVEKTTHNDFKKETKQIDTNLLSFNLLSNNKQLVVSLFKTSIRKNY